MRVSNIRRAIIKCLSYILLLIILVILLFPHFVMITTSLKSLEDVYDQRWFPSDPQFSNFIEIWKIIPLGKYLSNSLIITCISVLLVLIFSVTTAYATSRLRFKGWNIFLYCAIALQMFGSEIIIVGLFKVMRSYGLINTFLSLILVNTTFNLPMGIWIAHNYFCSVPIEIDESARIDGATHTQILVHILLPVITPIIVIISIITFLNVWNEFLVALTFMSDPLKRPVTVGLHGLIGLWQTKWNYLMLGSLISTVPALIIMLVFFRELKGGLVLGSLKS